MTDTLQSRILQPKRVPISHDYRLSNHVLGLGINGKVVECYSKTDGQKYALKVTDELLTSVHLSAVVKFISYLYINIVSASKSMCSVCHFFVNVIITITTTTTVTLI